MFWHNKDSESEWCAMNQTGGVVFDEQKHFLFKAIFDPCIVL